MVSKILLASWLVVGCLWAQDNQVSVELQSRTSLVNTRQSADTYLTDGEKVVASYLVLWTASYGGFGTYFMSIDNGAAHNLGYAMYAVASLPWLALLMVSFWGAK